MTRPKLTGLGSRSPIQPPVYYCACGCGKYASLGMPGGRMYAPGHVPAPAPPSPVAAPAPREVKRAHPSDLFDASGILAPIVASRPSRRGTR